MTRRNNWRGNDPWETVAMIAGMGAFVGAGVGVGGALYFADRRVSGVEVTLELLEGRVSRLERETGVTGAGPG